MVLVGPGVIMRGLSPNTAICGFGDFGYLGPSVGLPPVQVDPVSKIFLLVGKILAIRRMIVSDVPTPPAGPTNTLSSLTVDSLQLDTAAGPAQGTAGWSLYANLENAQMATIQQQAGEGGAGFNAYEVVWEAQSNVINNLSIQFDQLVADTDDAVRGVFQRETAVVISVDPNASLNAKVSAVIQYMQERNLYVEDSDYGMRDYLMTVLRDVDNIPAAFPATADDPDFPDDWITPIPVDPTAVNRTWNILW